MKLRLVLLLVIGVMALGTLAACGGDDDDDDDTPTATTAAVAPTATSGSGGGSDDGAAAAGETIAQANCITCHSTDGSTLVGPTWQGLYERDVELESGETVVADDAYIRESIVDPDAKVVKGYPKGVMFSFEDLLTDEDIDNLIAYIKTL